MTLAQDNIVGTDADEIFSAFIFNNSNTLQSGDMVDGAGGMDTLFADIGDSQNFAITPHTNSVEKLQVRAQAISTDSNENNMHNGVQIDAERMVGTTWYESNNSRADVTIEDVRILRSEAYGDDSDQITQNVTVAMVSTDPGNVDLGVYFDQHSLVNEGDSQSNSITLTIGNQIEEPDFDAAAPLKDVPYTNVGFLVNGEQIILALDLTDVETYDDLWAVMEASFDDAKAGDDFGTLLSNVTITRSIGTDTFFSKDGVLRSADEYLLLIEEGEITPSDIGWTAEGGLPSNNAFSATVTQGDVTLTSNLITSEIILDDVGRGSMGGDLIVGGLSIGTGVTLQTAEGTSDSKGVEQFNITVERSSELQEIQSTNNTLEEVYIVNGDTNGDLVVAGDTNLGLAANQDDLPGSDVNGAGFRDVRVLDASAMVGKVDLNAELTSAVVAKYLDLKDDATDAAADNVGFMYDLGTNDDNLDLLISSANLASAGTTTREDFYLNVNGNAGDDTITTTIATGFVPHTTNWYVNSKINANLTVNGGAGDDTIKTIGAGDFFINGDSGNDTVYANNDGVGIAARIAEVQTLTFGTAGDLDTQGQVTVTLSDGQTFTTGTRSTALVTGDTAATVAAAVALEMAGGTETSVVTFVNSAAAAGETVTVGGLILTVTNAAGQTSVQIAAAFASVANGATPADSAGNYTFSGALTGWSSAAIVGSTVTFTSATPNAAVADLVISDTIAALNVSQVITQGVATISNVTATPIGDTIQLTYGVNYSPTEGEDVASATISNIATDAQMGVTAETNGTGTVAIDALLERLTITTTDFVGATTDIIFANDVTGTGAGAGTTLTVNDTDGNGTITAFEIAQQIAAHSFVGYDLDTSVPNNNDGAGFNPSLGEVYLVAKTAGAKTDMTIASAAAAPAVTAQGADAVAQVDGIFETQTITIGHGADRSGEITLTIDGVEHKVAVPLGNEVDVAATVTSYINGLTDISAVQGAAGAATANTVVVTWATVGPKPTITMLDGALISSSVAETQKGIEASTGVAATWAVNASDVNFVDLESNTAITTGVLYKSTVTVTYSGARSADSGVINDAAVENSNGFESTVTIGTTNNLGSQLQVNQAIKDAINNDAVLNKLLMATDGPSNTLVITSLVDGRFEASDLEIKVEAPSSLTSAEATSVNAAYEALIGDSTANLDAAGAVAAIEAHIAVLDANGAYTTEVFAQTGGVDMAGSTSTSDSDNTINLGSGDDVAVLGTDDTSNDTLVMEGTFGNDSIFNFDNSTGAAQDMLDFTAYLMNEVSASGSTASTVYVAVTGENSGTSGAILTANEVSTFNDFSAATSESWANLTAADLLAAITGGDSYGNITDASYNVATVTDLVGDVQNGIIMVENDKNDGEYKVFSTFADDSAAEFTAVTLVGTLDFGDTIDASVAGLLTQHMA